MQGDPRGGAPRNKSKGAESELHQAEPERQPEPVDPVLTRGVGVDGHHSLA